MVRTARRPTAAGNTFSERLTVIERRLDQLERYHGPRGSEVAEAARHHAREALDELRRYCTRRISALAQEVDDLRRGSA